MALGKEGWEKKHREKNIPGTALFVVVREQCWLKTGYSSQRNHHEFSPLLLCIIRSTPSRKIAALHVWEIKSLFYQTPTSGEIPLLPKIHQESHLSLRRPQKRRSLPSPLKKPDSFHFFFVFSLLLNRRVRAVALLLLRLLRRLLRGGLLGICCCCRLLLLLLHPNASVIALRHSRLCRKKERIP